MIAFRVLLVLALLLTAAAAGAHAADQAPAAATLGSGGGAAKPSAETSDTINRIIQDNEAMLSGRGFTYDPAGRRDPFRSLVDNLNSMQKGPRPRGIAGMLISEVDLVGIVMKGRVGIAFF
ncbi:MAG TPA: hypothetical protein VN972_01925, partial [Methylomirabilota bacterium]|nr:hypothetical protein [Methylomirabilota bacterium]